MYTNESYTCSMCFMLSKFKVQEERILSSAKLQISHFAGKKNKSMIKILKIRDPD